MFARFDCFSVGLRVVYRSWEEVKKTTSLDSARRVWCTTCCVAMTALRGGGVGAGRRRPPLAPLLAALLPCVLVRGPRGKTLDVARGLVAIGVVALELPACDSTSDVSCPSAKGESISKEAWTGGVRMLILKTAMQPS